MVLACKSANALNDSSITKEIRKSFMSTFFYNIFFLSKYKTIHPYQYKVKTTINYLHAGAILLR